jgi:hypothetical protein
MAQLNRWATRAKTSLSSSPLTISARPRGTNCSARCAISSPAQRGLADRVGQLGRRPDRREIFETMARRHIEHHVIRPSRSPDAGLGRSSAAPSRSRPACPASSLRETSVTARSVMSPQRSARARSRSSSCTSSSRPNDSSSARRSMPVTRLFSSHPTGPVSKPNCIQTFHSHQLSFRRALDPRTVARGEDYRIGYVHVRVV